MQKILMAALAVTIISCNSGDKTTTTESKEKTPMAINTAGYTVTYSSSFEMGDPKHAEAIASLWKDWDSGNLESSKSLFADSVQFLSSDGSVIEGPIDSALAATQAYRNKYTSVKSTVHAIFPVKSTDKNENWALIWGTEVHTDKSGKVDSLDLQETWRFNKDGKVDLLYQFQKALTPPKPSN